MRFRAKDKDDNIYYSGMFGGGETVESVEYRHSRNGNRFNKDDGDYLDPIPDSRTYGEARLLEHRLTQENKAYIGRREGDFRGNRQNPLAERSMPEYEGYEARLKQLRGGSCP
ncbi:hypothetical protein [Amycolatopsis sp. NPDC051071]|uniref:hypothetical protein n=1 Tax=Amycolatopsis sp. NPDC051071 TaxID=3154637 RepID=UPI00342DFC18